MEDSIFEDDIKMEYILWRHSADEREKKLYNTILDYQEEYFKDMTLQSDSILHDFLHTEFADEEGDFHAASSVVQMKMSSIENYYYRIKIIDTPKPIGRINYKDRVIEFSPQSSEMPDVIMHEMIHAYEDSLGEHPAYYRDILFLCLYKDLSSRIENLDSYILKFSSLVDLENIQMRGGRHSILFFLKSLDIDLRMKYEFGTTFGYGRASEWKDYSTI